MIFHSWQFGVFLAVTLVLYWTLANRRGARLTLLLVASFIFFGSYEVWFLGLLVFSSALDYVCGKIIGDATSRRGRIGGLAVSLLGNLGLLCYFKYSKWVAEVLDPCFADLGVQFSLMHVAWKDVVPVGISFYTFQTLSYTIDIYRGVLAPIRSARDFTLFVSFFPQLVAGPIVRAIDFLPQLALRPRFDRERLHGGIHRIVIGLVKKTLLADQLAAYIVGPVYADPGSFSPEIHLIALYAFAFQIYCDFSGYSDIAIGSARLFGFDIRENFNGPYKSQSVREFWRRWHISLSGWVRDYIYFPLGGSRGSEARVVRNLLITMIIIGLWHGASVLWLIYGFVQGVAMIVERTLERLRGGKAFATTLPRKAVSWLLTFHFTVATCVFIRAESPEEFLLMFQHFGTDGWREIAPHGYVALLAATLTHFVPERLADRFQTAITSLPTWLVGVFAGLGIGAVLLATVGNTPFIYFQF